MTLLSGCQTISFYQQAISGQSRLLLDRTDISELIAAPDTDPKLRERLELAQQIIEFAQEAGLPAENAYSSYVATDRPYVVWNVFAAPALELRLQTSCFPVAGCVSYRGYFERDDAMEQAQQLQESGFDVYVGGVAAYSTLGWFDDPLLDTFLFRSEEDLAALLFHELAHRLLYVKDDTRFNESLASSVERVLLRRWLTERGGDTQFEEYLESEKKGRTVLRLIDQTREKLRELYASDLPDAEKLLRKKQIIQQMVADYGVLAADWPDGGAYAYWMNSEINNAKLETVADYNTWVPVMSEYLEAHGIEQFTTEMQRLAELSQTEREAELKNFGSQSSR